MLLASSYLILTVPPSHCNNQKCLQTLLKFPKGGKKSPSLRTTAPEEPETHFRMIKTPCSQPGPLLLISSWRQLFWSCLWSPCDLRTAPWGLTSTADFPSPMSGKLSLLFHYVDSFVYQIFVSFIPSLSKVLKHILCHLPVSERQGKLG